jgi:hypothetical protein
MSVKRLLAHPDSPVRRALDGSADRREEFAGWVKSEARLPRSVYINPILLELESQVDCGSQGMEEDMPTVPGPGRKGIAPISKG